eukprot:jgi/Mesvir1/2908/Mv25451-RA.1
MHVAAATTCNCMQCVGETCKQHWKPNTASRRQKTNTASRLQEKEHVLGTPMCHNEPPPTVTTGLMLTSNLQ